MTHQNFYKQSQQSPYKLKSTQEWFAGIITNRLTQEDTIQPYTSKGTLVAEESAYYITPGPNLSPHQRIQIYNQQYWWRLLNTLHANFPLLTRLFGPQAFNEKIGIPYLMECPPNHWSLNVLGERLPNWLQEYYDEPDQTLVYDSACLDWAFMTSYITMQHPPLDLTTLVKEPETLLTMTFFLQPYIYLFKWEYDLLAFREDLLKQDFDYWIENPFPELPKGENIYYVLYQNNKKQMAYRKMSQGEFLFLECFKSGSSVTAACQYIEAQEAMIYEQVSSEMQNWLQDWTRSGWLTAFSDRKIK